VPLLCEVYPGICLTTEENARKNLSQGKKTKKYEKFTFFSVRVSVSKNKEWF